MKQADVFILVGGQGSRLSVLSEHRAKPAMPFAGKYRIIDFALTNCVYSGLFHIYMLTQYRPRSLMDHVGVGKPWDLDRKWGGVEFLHPYLGNRQGSSWYGGTADALVHNIDVLKESVADNVLILSGDHVYKMNYSYLLDTHIEKGHEATIGVIEVSKELASQFGIVSADETGTLLEFEEKPANPKSTLASMGVYAFKRESLIETLERLQPDYPNLDFGKHVIPDLIPNRRVGSYLYRGFWLDIGTVNTYFSASMDLLADDPPLSLFDQDWHILTKEHNRAPTCIESSAIIRHSMITDGSHISGTVEDSVLGPGVVVEEGAQVRSSIIMEDCLIRRDAIVDRCILDKRVRLGAGARVGIPVGNCDANEEQPDVLSSNITVIGKDVRVPARQVIGTNCLIDMLAAPDDFKKRTLVDGSALRTHRIHHTVR